jgi:hypothetical protein
MSQMSKRNASESEASFDDLVAFLRTTGAGEVAHTETHLLDHLVQTYAVLASWGCPEYLCRAGLFHSIYGTEFFTETTLPLTERGRVRDVIGADAERIAYLWGIVHRESIYANEDFIVNREDGSRIPVTRQDIADLWTLDLANALEVITRYELSADDRRKGRELYERGIEFFPPAGVEAMRQAYGSAG